MINNLTRKEKILIAVLLILVFALVYYRFIYLNINQARTEANKNVEQLQNEVNFAKTKLARVNKMKDTMDAGVLSRMGSYNSSKLETAFLHTVLSEAPDYSIAFDTVTRDGDQIRRNFNLRFTANNYKQAKSIMKALADGEFRCLPGDVNCEIADNGTTKVNMTATFYETMVGGVEDSALPADASASEQSEEY